MIEIVGIARNSKYTFVSEPPKDFVYLPFRQHQRSALVLVAESNARDARTLAPVLRDVVRGIDPDMPVFDVQTMSDFFAQIVAKADVLTRVVAAMGLMGLLLAVVGLYGLVAYSVSRRTREIGIRMAVGADQPKVVWMVLRQGLQLGLAGVAVGLAAEFLRLPFGCLDLRHRQVQPVRSLDLCRSSALASHRRGAGRVGAGAPGVACGSDAGAAG